MENGIGENKRMLKEKKFGELMYEVATIVWNMFLDMWDVIGDFCEYLFVGVILPISLLAVCYFVVAVLCPEAGLAFLVIAVMVFGYVVNTYRKYKRFLAQNHS